MSDAHTPLHDPARDSRDWTPSLDLARDVARDALTNHEGANIHDHTAMLRAATSLEFVLRDLLAALDKEAGE